MDPTNIIPFVTETSARGERTMDIYSLLLRERIVFLGTPINDPVTLDLPVPERIPSGPFLNRRSTDTVKTFWSLKSKRMDFCDLWYATSWAH